MSVTTYPIVPVPKPRQTRADKWKERPCVLRYRAFADAVRAAGVRLPESGAAITFTLPMSASWSQKKKALMYGKPHRQKPDLSNLLKALEDAVYGEDCHIWNYKGLTKFWGDAGRIRIQEASNAEA